MHQHKQPERRTFLQDRFDILIKRQKEGKATFNELTELDAIVNADPVLKEKFIMESLFPEDFNKPENDPEKEKDIVIQKQRVSLLNQVKAFFGRIFTLMAATIKNAVLISRTNQAAFL